MIERIEKDKDFLWSCHLMDYSLLLFIFKKRDLTEKRLKRGYTIYDKFE